MIFISAEEYILYPGSEMTPVLYIKDLHI